MAPIDTPQPPTTEAISSLSASGGGSPAIGVTDDTMGTTTTAADSVVGATTGAAQPGIIMENVGGIGPEVQPHIGLDMNILSLAGQKIFQEVKKFSSGIGQGVVILDLPISPWSSTVLNKFAYSWADLHDSFYGALYIHAQIVTSSTLMGTAKCAFIPRIYSKDFVIEQANVDDFNAVEIAVNVNGEGTLYMRR